MENSSNGWIRLAVVTGAVVALIGAMKTILRFLTDFGEGRLNWSLA